MKTTKGYAGLYADGSHTTHAWSRTLLGKNDCEGIYAQAIPIRSVRESDFRAMQRIVRNAADMPCKCVAVNLNNCLSCQARKVMKK